MHHRLAIGTYKQAYLRLFAEILWYNFEGTTYDTRLRRSCLVFRVCGNYALMRVVHCGVLAARASLFSLLGFIFTLFFHIVPGSTRVLEYTGFHHLRPNHYTIVILCVYAFTDYCCTDIV